ncbi:ankyrin repeat domain-containing protein 13C isoform X2 [Cimex lectularius]|uniref:Ankyrin repeat domain-containing protein n=1 Tax=Cimex lectularius TaxID=79782 RepID=A0A8I6SHY5_CIMLE|nr:ankyrin repeat domain-containing protein 13C isoform X2 [Cimex lectularius]
MADGQNNTSYPLHESVFNGYVKKLSGLLRTNNVEKKDKHGNTALHLAVMLGRKECVQLLLAHNAPVRVKNLAGWSPLAEAISYGDRQTIVSLVRKLKSQRREHIEKRRPSLVEALKQMGDFYMELKWDFTSWVPLVSRVLPSDICKIHKKGSCIRLDSTLVDFNDMRWERGDVSFLFIGHVKPSEALTILDNKEGLYQRVRYEETETEIEDEVDILMSSDIMAAQMSTKSITFTKAQSGWFFREDRKETVGTFEADVYDVNGMVLESRKRREHLSEEDLQKNKAIMEKLTKGNTPIIDCNGEVLGRRSSLTPPANPRVSWEEYINSEPGEYPTLGRKLVHKETTKAFRATVAMSPNFPLSVSMLLDVLEVIGPFKHFNKLREFIQIKLPPGFPVKIEIPILPTVTAKITFQDFEFKDEIDSKIFEIPPYYVEDQNRFPDI